MRRLLTPVLAILLVLLMPAGIALGACHSADTVERGLERDHLVNLVDEAGNPAGCAVLLAHEPEDTDRYDPSLGVFTSPDPVERSMSQPFSGSYNYVDGMPTQYTDPMGTCLGSGYASCGDMFKGYGSVLASTPAVAYENYQGVTQGIADKVVDTAVGFGTMCLNGAANHTWSTVAGPIGNCAAGAGEALGGAAASVYNSCNTTTRHHDAMGTAQCYGNVVWSASQRYAAECASDFATSGYAAGNGCVGDFTLLAGAGAAGRAGALAGRGTRLHWSDGNSRVPGAWGDGLPNSKGEGRRWEDPLNAGNGIRIDKGNPNSPFPSQRVDHVVVRLNGEVLGRDGQPINGSIKANAEMAHIPLAEWMQWSTWSSK